MRRLLRPRGAASLIVVMVLFFLMMMAAAFNSRSLVFEQKTSANQYRYTQAFEAGEAGLQWALSMLDGGRIDASCNPTADTAQTTFRDRYLRNNLATGRLQPAPDVTAGCVKSDAGWSCSCPATGEAALVQPSGSGNLSTFTVRFVAAPQPGMVTVQARGCSSYGAQCVPAAAQRSDADVEVKSLIALAGGLRTPPSAALTARGDVTLVGPDVGFTNTDEETHGITVNAGGAICGATCPTAPTPRLTTTPGSLASQSIVQNDASLSALLYANRVFVTFFGIDKQAFQRLGSVRRLSCQHCAAAVQRAYDEGYRMFWFDNDVVIDGSATLGSPTDPLLLVGSGNVQLGGSARLHGVVYSAAETWNNGSGSAQLHGAAIAEGDFSASGSPHFVYDPEVLARLHFRTATFARVSGGWSDTR